MIWVKMVPFYITCRLFLNNKLIKPNQVTVWFRGLIFSLAVTMKEDVWQDIKTKRLLLRLSELCAEKGVKKKQILISTEWPWIH